MEQPLLVLLTLQSWWNADHGTWALVIVGVCGTVVALRTLSIINRQTKAMKASTDALISSERAWIMVSLDRVPGGGGVFDGEEIIRDIITQKTSFSVRIVCKNEGKTPAWVTEKRARIDVVDSLPEKPDWEDIEIIQAEPEPVAVDEKTTRDECLTCNKARDFGKMIVIFGIVRYRDIFADNRSTTFGYRLRVDDSLERLAAYPEYNRNS